MTVRRRRGPLPLPPPLGGIAIDGGNVVANAAARALPRLDLAVAWFREWRPDLEIAVFLDSTAFARCEPAMQDSLHARFAARAQGVRFVLCPPRAEADPLLLEYAAKHRALVVSNDRFFDHEALRADALTVQFELAGTRFEPFAEATWFRGRGKALRVAMQDLRERRAPPG
jgi:hypothetical protein